jgi:hypothetical protein
MVCVLEQIRQQTELLLLFLLPIVFEEIQENKEKMPEARYHETLTCMRQPKLNITSKRPRRRLRSIITLIFLLLRRSHNRHLNRRRLHNPMHRQILQTRLTTASPIRTPHMMAIMLYLPRMHIRRCLCFFGSCGLHDSVEIIH